MLLFENNFKCSEISIEMEVLRQSARNITSISLLFLSKHRSLLDPEEYVNLEQRKESLLYEELVDIVLWQGTAFVKCAYVVSLE